MVDDARYNTKAYLETYLLNTNLTEDNDVYHTGAAGTADSGSVTTTVDTERTEADHYWNNYYIKYGSGPNSGMERLVSHFDSGTDTLTHAAFPYAVAATDTYVLSLTSTQVNFIVCFGNPNYAVVRVFIDKDVDLVFSVGTPDSEALPVGIGYLEKVPISIFTIDKTGITGTELRWKAEAELRRVNETYPLGSLRSLERISDNEKNLGSTTLYSVTHTLRYKRYSI
ncbi:hypothetical protein MUO83_07850 [Candidatus Bathyarchaeota archaeon]|nr:hypothetical protein [Candidatus Bathyarchaeota archaeon]